jgi:hypothetical protein
MRSKKSDECVVVSCLLKKLVPDALPHLSVSEEPAFPTTVDQKVLGVEVHSPRDELVSSGDTLLAAT